MREYLAVQGGQAAAADGQSQQQQQQQQQQDPDLDMEEGDYVYDLYAADSGDEAAALDEGPGDGGWEGQRAAWLAAAGRGTAPLVRARRAAHTP